MSGQGAVLGPARGGRLHELLVRGGHVTESGVSRRVTARACLRCGAPVLAGLDGDVMAFEARVDPEPLNGLGEALAVLEGRGTWALHREQSRYVLDTRDSHEIAAHPATSQPREDVLREHRCSTAAPGSALVAPCSFAPPTTSTLPPGAPAPF